MDGYAALDDLLAPSGRGPAPPDEVMITGADPVSVYCKEWNPAGSWYDRDASAVAVFEMTGGTNKLDAFIKLMAPLGLVEISRTGVVAISRGADAPPTE